MKYYKRESYLKKIRGFYNDTEIIKVITGVRRCGNHQGYYRSPTLRKIKPYADYCKRT